MTARTIQPGMFPGQREAGNGMVEVRIAPTAGRMTGTTIRAKLTVVCILVGVTGITVRGRSLVTIRMAGGASYSGVSTLERETGKIMVEVYIRPLGWLVTGTTVRTELTVVMVLVGMTGIAISGSTLVTVRMAGLAGNARMGCLERETGLAVIEVNILPGGRSMTASTVIAELSIVSILGGMAGGTIRWCASIASIGMARCATYSAVAARQRETGPTVVEVDILPTSRVMTIGTVPAHLPGVWIAMTGGTIGGRAFEQQVGVATCTRYLGMPACQMEDGRGVVEGRIIPGGRGMTLFTFLPQQTHMRIILLMTGETILRRTFEKIIGMAIPARHTDMRRQQFEIGAVMVKVDDTPILRGMAGGAIGAQLSLMRIVRCMTGRTILRRRFEIGKSMSISVTLLTLYRNMLAG